MKRRIILVLLLMSICVAGITCLQLYWNYQNYKSTLATFKHDINDALNKAVDKEIDQRHQMIIAKFKSWLADTSFVQITCNNHNRLHLTKFHLADTHPYEIRDKGTDIGFTSFKQSLSKITPYAKTAFINNFADRVVKSDLKKGDLYFYTQRLGDSLSIFYNHSKADLFVLKNLYHQELLAKDIHASFILNALYPDKQWPYLTQKVGTALRRPYESQFVRASFKSPDLYFLKESRLLILSSFLLICITIFCFFYTLKTLFSQHKLALLKDDFINNMTHEINTPLASIAITAEALKTFKYERRTQKEYLDIITYQVEKLTLLTGQMLNAGKLSKNSLQNTVRIELNSLIDKAINDLFPQIKNTAAQINYHAGDDPIYVKSNATDLLNALVNIIDNSLKYAINPPVLDINILHEHQHAVLIFADNGIGIPAEYHNRVFEKFFRVPTGNLHDVKGYGLGLSYVLEVVKQSGGSISVTMNKPTGSIFTIKLPLC